MREIKFRGYSESKWIYGWLVKNQAGHYYIRSCHDFHTYGVKPETIGQYIGLKDKNGKEIYDGDILKVGENLVCEIVYVEKNVEDYGDEIHSAFHAKVYRHNKTIPLDSYLKNNCVLIGNIHENPELL